MRHIISSLLIIFFLLSSQANALLIKDVFNVNRLITAHTGVGTIFELIPLGYAPATDFITRVKLTYDFVEIFSPDNQGDDEQYNDPDYPLGGGPIYKDEPAILSSWIFNWRDFYGDIDTGLIEYETDWIRSEMCQYEAFDEASDEAYCTLNLDLYGNLNAGVLSFSDNLWLNSISAEVEFNRKTPVPEPNLVLLFGLALLMVGIFRQQMARRIS
jgi:hypothetical protein